MNPGEEFWRLLLLQVWIRQTDRLMIGKFLTVNSAMGIAFKDIVFMLWFSMTHLNIVSRFVTHFQYLFTGCIKQINILRFKYVMKKILLKGDN